MNERDSVAWERRRKALEEQLYGSAGYRALSWIRYVRMTLGVFRMNRDDMMEWLAQLSFPEYASPIFDVDHRERLDRFNLEVLRRLHNFVASGSTLIDHSRIAVRMLYEQHEFRHEYKRELANRVLSKPIAAFFPDLRNFVLHKGFPTTLATQHFTPYRAPVYALSTESLATYKRWSPGGKEFMASEGESINLAFAVDRYAALISSFHKWLASRQAQIHRDQFHETRHIEARLREVVKGRRSLKNEHGE